MRAELILLDIVEHVVPPGAKTLFSVLVPQRLVLHHMALVASEPQLFVKLILNHAQLIVPKVSATLFPAPGQRLPATVVDYYEQLTLVIENESATAARLSGAIWAESVANLYVRNEAIGTLQRYAETGGDLEAVPDAPLVGLPPVPTEPFDWKLD